MKENNMKTAPVLEAIPEPVHPPKSTRIANWIIALALVVVAISIGVFLKWSFASEKILEIYNSPFPARVVNDPSGNTGGIVFLKSDYCKSSNMKGTLRISYVSQSREIFLPISPEQLPKGCDTRDVPILIPKDLVPDTYKIKFRSTYNINPLKQGIVTDFESQPFEVGAKTP